MSHSIIREQIIQEIELIPETRLPELFKLLHSFRLESKPDYSSKVELIMGFAGDWLDLDNQENFETEIKNRRSQASILRPQDQLSLGSFSTQVQTLCEGITGNNRSVVNEAMQRLKAEGVTRTDLALNLVI